MLGSSGFAGACRGHVRTMEPSASASNLALPLAMERATPLPVVAAAYLRRVAPDVSARRVWLRQRGAMWRRPGARPLPFTAEQRIEVDRVELMWRARFRLAPAVWMEVEDACVDGRGHLSGRLWGRIRVVHEDGPETTRGEILRYLAEIPWAPFALARNPALRVRELRSDALEVSVPAVGPRCAVELRLDARGDIVESRARGRPRLEGKTVVERPWGGRFWDHAEVDGVRLPRAAEVWWDLPSGRFVYWRARIVSASREG